MAGLGTRRNCCDNLTLLSGQQILPIQIVLKIHFDYEGGTFFVFWDVSKSYIYSNLL